VDSLPATLTSLFAAEREEGNPDAGGDELVDDRDMQKPQGTRIYPKTSSSQAKFKRVNFGYDQADLFGPEHFRHQARGCLSSLRNPVEHPIWDVNLDL